MTQIRSTLTATDSLATQDMLLSPGGTYHLEVTGDGRLVIAFGSGRWDPLDAAAATFLGTAGAPGAYTLRCRTGQFGVFGPDGVMVLAVGPGGSATSLTMNDDGTLGCTFGGGSTSVFGKRNMMVSIDRVLSLTYDLQNAVIGKATPTDLYTTSATNPSSSQTQKISVAHTEGVTEMQSWSNTVGGAIEIKSSFSTGIPFIAEGKVEVTLKTTYTYQWGGSSTKVRNMSFSADLVCPPQTEATCVMLITISPITVPYTTIADVTFADGLKLTNLPIIGLYQGLTAHNLQAAYKYLPLAPTQTAATPAVAAATAVPRDEVVTMPPGSYSFADD